METIEAVARAIGRSEADVKALTDGLAAALRESLAEADTVALPGFGTFEAIKEPERITTDLSTGQRLLLPPAITTVFRASALLRRKIQQTPSES